MVHTIDASVGGARRSRRAMYLALAHAGGGALGGFTLGVAVYLLASSPVAGALQLILFAVLAFGLAGYTGLVRNFERLSSRQVPEYWRRMFRPTVVMFFYGVGLGVGFGTRIATLAFPALLAEAIGLRGFASIVIACIVFGATRSIVHIGIADLARHSLDVAESRLEALRAPVRWCGIASAVVAMLVVVSG